MRLTVIVLFGLLLAALIGAGIWLYTPDKARPALEARYLLPIDTYRLVGGVHLHVRDSGHGPVLILLHGFGASLQTWDAWADRLSTEYRVVRFDVPGFGLTGPDPTGDYSDRRSMDILASLMDQLGIARATLIGNSMGGKIAWNFAASRPDRVDRLVLISPDGFASPGFDYGRKPDLPFMVRLLPYTLPTFLVRMSLAPAYADPGKLTGATVTRYRDMMLVPGVRAAIVARMSEVMLEDPVPLLRRVQAPTLLLWGEDDAMIPFSNAADYLRAMPHARLVALPGLGHVPFEEAPERSLKPVLEFLSEPNRG